MRILYFDCFAGLREDMVLGALLQAGVSEDYLREQLKSLNIEGYQIRIYRERDSFFTSRVEIVNREQSQFAFQDIVHLIESSSVSAYVKEKVLNIFTTLAQAESKVKGLPPELVQFSQLNIFKTVLSIAGIAICIEKFAPDKILMSPLSLGSGLMNTPDGWMPVPSPVTAELVKNMPVKLGPVEGELVTPLGAALVSVFVDHFGPPPVIVPSSLGYGRGSGDHGIPNILRVIVGEVDDAPE